MGENGLFGSHEHKAVLGAGSDECTHTHVCLGHRSWQRRSARARVLAQPEPSLVPSLRAEITGQQGSAECQELLR